MAIFDRIRRARTSDQGAPDAPEVIPPHLLPEINQRVTVSNGERVPVPSRVEDVAGGMVELAFPALPIEFGDELTVSWERDEAWFSLTTCVLGLDAHAVVPTIRVAASGRLARHDERHALAERTVSLPIELRVVRARAIRPGRELRTYTTEVSGDALRFATTAPFAPGDVLEARIQLNDTGTDVVSARVRVNRVDQQQGAWRATCSAAFDEILRSDRAKLMAFADAAAAAANAAVAPDPAASTAPTADGVGGRDEPASLASYESAVEWLRRRG